MNRGQIYVWYEKYKNGIYRYILSLTHDPELAEDVLQDTFMKLLTTETYDEFCLSVGSMENELWKYCFSLNDEGIWTPDAPPLDYTTEQYNGVTLQICTTVLYDIENSSKILGFHHSVTWVDAHNRTVFILRKYLPNDTDAQKIPAEMLEFAKKIVDMNHLGE